MKRRLAARLTTLTLLTAFALSTGGCTANNAMCDWRLETSYHWPATSPK